MSSQVEGQALPGLTRRNRFAGAVLVLIGAYVAYQGYGYGLGQVFRLGPGALPFGLGLLSILFGVLIALVDPDGAEAAPVIRWRPVLSILGALLAFALLIDTAGLVIATAALVFISCAADPDHTWRSMLGIYGFLLGFVYIVFVHFLSIPFAMFWG
ncbi:MAG: tripartite tricarboxylate transporter TctB family protein [Paracoccaceae bacterium]